MANVWPVYEGSRPTGGEPWAILPLSQAVEVLRLEPAHFCSDHATTPRFGKADRDLWYLGFKHIVVEVEPREAREPEWKAGFYLSPFRPKEALHRLLYHFLTPTLGEHNVERFELEPMIDSEGRSTQRFTVVIKPGAAKKIPGLALMKAISRLRDSLPGLVDDGTPVVEYATEAELATNASA